MTESLNATKDILAKALAGGRLAAAEAHALIAIDAPAPLMQVAAALRDRGHGNVVSYSRKVFIPLTRLCRDVCHYCTFAEPPRRRERPYLTPDEVLAIAEAGAAAGCKEALFTLGDKPELRYRAAREALVELGYETTLEYLAAMARRVFEETGLLPHLNPGVMSDAEIASLRAVSVSQGLMLENVSPRLCEKGGPHYGSPDKAPQARIATIDAAGRHAVPFTSGILIGIGETRAERIDSLLALRDLHERHGHLQEIIVQNFRAKPGTRMAAFAEPPLEELLWTVAAARVIFGPDMTIQAPPNLSPGALPRLVEAGIDDWGGVSPVTPDHVNPEAPWPHLDALADETAAAGKLLTERLAIYPAYAQAVDRWTDPAFHAPVRRAIDSDGFARLEDWSPGAALPVPALATEAGRCSADLTEILAKAEDGADLAEGEIARLFRARGGDLSAVCATADRLRRKVNGDTVSYVVNRNINYTNICYFRCRFCAFSKGTQSESLRGRPYDLGLDEIERRCREAWDRGATEICLQGGIHPDYTGRTYLEICRRIKSVLPDIHLHGFTPLEVWQGAQTLGMPVDEFLGDLRDAGLGTLPGTAAEVLDDEVRAIICPDKISTDQWLSVMEAAHAAGLRSTATIMFGHVDGPRHWARHLLRLRELQKRTGGFTEFVPLPFVPMASPIYLKGNARRGPTFREAVLMHAVGRLALHPHFRNIQTSWVKMGPDGAKACLNAGANDLGGTLMNESITRAAGASHGEEMPPERLEAIIADIGRAPRQRTTLYDDAPADRIAASFGAPPLAPKVETPAAIRARPADRGARELVRAGGD